MPPRPTEPEQPRKTEVLYVRLTKELKALVTRDARQNQRSVSAQVVYILTQHYGLGVGDGE
jgi:hypothetical protein